MLGYLFRLELSLVQRRVERGTERTFIVLANVDIEDEQPNWERKDWDKKQGLRPAICNGCDEGLDDN